MLSPSSLVLVCLLPSPRDLEIARLLGWYRIPLRTAPKVVAVDYLAFYQPSAFGERSGQIELFAPVRGQKRNTTKSNSARWKSSESLSKLTSGNV
jgi:hypothetical protein